MFIKMKKIFLLLCLLPLLSIGQTLNLNNNSVVISPDSVTFTQNRVHVDTLSFPDGTYYASADGRGIINVNNTNYTMLNTDRTVSDSAYSHNDTIYLPANPTAEWLRTIIQTNGGSLYSVVCGNGHRIWLNWQYYKVDAQNPATFSFNAVRDKWEINSPFDETMGVDTNQYPAERVNLSAWYRSDSLITLSRDGNVSEWGDISGNITPNDAVQETVGYQPAFVTNQFNGHPIIRTDGSDDKLDLTTPIAVSTTWTVFAVVNLGGGGGYWSIVNGANTAIGFGSSTNACYFYNGGEYIGNVAMGTISTPTILCYVCDGSTIAVYKNGVDLSSTIVGYYGVTLTELFGYLFGAYDTAEVLIYDEPITESHRIINTNALLARYNITP
jgi:hypothetical protein